MPKMTWWRALNAAEAILFQAPSSSRLTGDRRAPTAIPWRKMAMGWREHGLHALMHASSSWSLLRRWTRWWLHRRLLRPVSSTVSFVDHFFYSASLRPAVVVHEMCDSVPESYSEGSPSSAFLGPIRSVWSSARNWFSTDPRTSSHPSTSAHASVSVQAGLPSSSTSSASSFLSSPLSVPVGAASVSHGNGDLNALLGTDLSFLTRNLERLIQAQHPLLDTIVRYYFNAEGKKFRPLVVLLMARAIGVAMPGTCDRGAGAKSVSSDPLLPSHIQLAMITELIHTASLLHDDVIDDADLRRSRPSVNVAFGNKMAILGGDFLLSRASLALARLGVPKVVELMAEVIGELVEGEVIQFRGGGAAADPDPDHVPQSSIVPDKGFETQPWIQKRSMSWGAPQDKVFPSPVSDHFNSHRRFFESYLNKSYMKTASLIAKSCRCAVLLYDAYAPVELQQVAFHYGKHLGVAFQLIDDLLDFTSTSEHAGKRTGGVDLKLGLATAPVLYASMEYPDFLLPLIDRRLGPVGGTTSDDELKRALELVGQSRGLEWTRRLAEWHSGQAVSSLSTLPESEARQALVNIAHQLLHRSK